MAAQSHAVRFDAAALIRGLNIQLKQAMADTLEQVARQAQANWQESIRRQSGIWQPLKDRYADSVMCVVNRDRLTARIYSDDPKATEFETGEPARDLKRALDTSHKVRVAKSGPHAGQRYLIIPFRHGSPGNSALAPDMPKDVYKMASGLAKSTVTGQISMRSGLNASNPSTRGPLMTMRNTYAWGGRLGSGANIPRQHRGMVRFDTSSGKQNSSQYLTFRVMREGSTGWIVPAKPGRYIVKGVADDAQKLLEFGVRDAIAAVTGY